MQVAVYSVWSNCNGEGTWAKLAEAESVTPERRVVMQRGNRGIGIETSRRVRPNGSRLSCGRLARRRKGVGRRPCPPGAQHSASLRAIAARQLQALVRRHRRNLGRPRQSAVIKPDRLCKVVASFHLVHRSNDGKRQRRHGEAERNAVILISVGAVDDSRGKDRDYAD